MRNLLVAGFLVFLAVGLAIAHQITTSDDGGILALEKIWNHGIEEQNVKALDMLLADTMVSVDIDGSGAIEGRIYLPVSDRPFTNYPGPSRSKAPRKPTEMPPWSWA